PVRERRARRRADAAEPRSLPGCRQPVRRVRSAQRQPSHLRARQSRNAPRRRRARRHLSTEREIAHAATRAPGAGLASTSTPPDSGTDLFFHADPYVAKADWNFRALFL